jgi:hypothetical protein
MQPDNIDAPEFTDEQLRTALRCIGRDARQAAFAVGRPVLIVRDGWLVELHRDGTERVVGPVRPETGLNPKER